MVTIAQLVDSAQDKRVLGESFGYTRDNGYVFDTALPMAWTDRVLDAFGLEAFQEVIGGTIWVYPVKGIAGYPVAIDPSAARWIGALAARGVMA